MEKAYTMAEEPYTRIYARIDLDAIVKNMEAMRENLPAKTKMIGVVKTDGYGRGCPGGEDDRAVCLGLCGGNLGGRTEPAPPRH